MKSILLTTTAIVAFAGAAAAEGHTGVSFSGSATLGYNDGEETVVNIDGEDGFYWDADLGVSASAALDNGLTAGADFTILIADENNGNEEIGIDGDYVLSLTSDTAGMYFGDTEFAAITRWKSAGDMEADFFSEADGETVIRGDAEVAGVGVSLSYRVKDANGDLLGDGAGVEAATTEELDQLSIGVAADFGMVSMTAAYQEEAEAVTLAAPLPSSADANNGDFNHAEAFGISGTVAVAGADVTVGYAQQSEFVLGGTPEKTSLGVSVAYPFGPVTATVYFVSEDTDAGDVDDNYGLTVAYADGPIAVTGKVRNEQGRDEWNIDGSYDVGNGLTVLAGALNENEGDDFDYYVAGTYDLGGGAELLVAYAMDDDEDQADEIGAPEYMPGTTVEVSFSF